MRTLNVAVIGRKRSLRVPEMTPAFSVQLCRALERRISAHEPPNHLYNLRSKRMKMIKNFLNDESGMETLEYAVIAGLIAAVAIVVYASGWGTALSTRLNRATTTG
jgi:Flp pilus assembly pilin Flp